MTTGAATRRNADLDSLLADRRARLAAANPASLARHRLAAEVMPGGNTRSILHADPFPLGFAGGHGCRLVTLDGAEMIDLVAEYTAGLYGHSDPVIAAAMKEAIDAGLALGGPNLLEARYAAALVARFPAFEQVRFCNSGTEANIMAISAARAFTGRPEIIAMRGAYHGGVLGFPPGGSPLTLPFPVHLAPFNDADATRALIRARAGTLAAVILEPMLGAGGCIPAAPGFLEMIRDETAAAGALMILDEVMTSRLDPGGVHGRLGLRPDLVTMGKYLGGGASSGVFGGRAEVMAPFDPARPGAWTHSGTFNNNPLSLAGGLAGLTRVFTPDACRRLNDTGRALSRGMTAAIRRQGIAASVTGDGSLMNLHFVPGPVTCPDDLAGADPRHLGLWHAGMALRGFHVTPRGMIVLSLPFGAAESAAFLAAFEDFLAENAAVLPSAA